MFQKTNCASKQRNSNINLAKWSRHDRRKNEVLTSDVGAIRNRAKIQFYYRCYTLAEYRPLDTASATDNFRKRNHRPGSERDALSQIFRLEVMTWRRNMLLILVGHNKCFCCLNQTNHTVPTYPFISVCKPPVKWWFADFV